MAPTQEALYADLDAADLDLSWSEQQLPERVRTKHVHRLHPYLGKFVPQLVEALLGRYFAPGEHVLDPFAGSGTTLVQALESGLDATRGDVAAFNCLLVDVKTRPYNLFTLEHELRDACARLDRFDGTRPPKGTNAYVRRWFAPQAGAELLAFRDMIPAAEHGDVMRVVLARAARSARQTAHFDLDFPKTPQTEPYWCFKHKRECKPVETARQFLRRYALDTVVRVKEFHRVRDRERAATILHGDARELALPARYDGIVTSPPYPGLIDYHEQHRYAYELLGLDDRRELEVGAGAAGGGRAAITAYSDAIADVLARSAEVLRPGAPLLVVVNDRRGLYPDILDRAGLRLDGRHRRHVNRRTGRRAGESFEELLIARRA